MLTKRKATKKSLDELRKIMPVLSEKQQRACIGSARYYDVQGNFLGTFGSGLEMRVIAPESFSHLLSTGDSSRLHGTPLSSASDSTRRAVLLRYLPPHLADFEWTDQSGIFAGFTLGGTFRIGRGDWKDHHGDIMSIIAHETHHYNSGNFSGCWEEELGALMTQINCSTYDNTSHWLRQRVYERLIQTKEKLGLPINNIELMRLTRLF